MGTKILDRVAEKVVDVGKVEIMPEQDGRNITMVLGPDKKAQARHADAAAAGDRAGGGCRGDRPGPAEATEPAAVGDAT